MKRCTTPKPKPPSWCTKPKPCDYDPPSSYCPHRECMEALEAKLAAAEKERDEARAHADVLMKINAELRADIDEASPMKVCARCGKQDRAHRMMIEEGDEWECLPCWERCEAQEREAVKARSIFPPVPDDHLY